MVIAKLKGGLGNQMFQYAAARRLALHHNSELCLDLSYFTNSPVEDTPRQFAMGCFPICGRIATDLETVDLCHGFKGKLHEACYKLCKIVGISREEVFLYCEKGMAFDPKVLALPDNVCLSGYWQSEKYFKDISETIRREFQVMDPLQGKNLELASKMEGTNSVAVHIRGGDYVKNSQTRAFHGVLDRTYYDKAFQIISENITDPHFFIFSDDFEYVRNNFQFSSSVCFVAHNGADAAAEDLRLMSLCKHHVIANSSFSWWGAWLSRGGGQFVIAPKHWFLGASVETSDLFPENWITVGV